MKAIFEPGDVKQHTYLVKEEDVASFNGEVVHKVCSTYTLTREMEWAGRLFVIEMLEPHEEGIGTMVEVIHSGPAFPGEELVIESEVHQIQDNRLICNITVRTLEGRKIAHGKTGQMILPIEKINDIFTK
jgi:predicted thioesterase